MAPEVEPGKRYVIRHGAYGTFEGEVLHVFVGWFSVRVTQPNGKMVHVHIAAGEVLELSAAFCTFREVG